MLPLRGTVYEEERRRELMGLVRGRMLLLSQGKRRTTANSYRAGRAALAEFAEVFALRAPPVPPFMLMDWAVYGISSKELDSSTVKLRLQAVYDMYDYARSRLGFRALANPLRDPEVVALGRVVGADYKKRSRARTAVTLLVCAAMLLGGWDLSKPAGKWGRLLWTFLNLGMLRVGAALSIIVLYEIIEDGQGRQTVLFQDGSGVFVRYDDASGRPYIVVDVDVDKNVRAWNRREAYIPDEVTSLKAAPVEWLIDYILAVRPPSGGRLLAKPGRKPGKFSDKPANPSADIKRAYKRACQRGLITFDQAIHDALGTHSGRNSLAPWLWDDGRCRRIIADAGGWFLKRDAVDLYFKTAAHVILRYVRDVGSAQISEGADERPPRS